MWAALGAVVLSVIVVGIWSLARSRRGERAARPRTGAGLPTRRALRTARSRATTSPAMPGWRTSSSPAAPACARRCPRAWRGCAETLREQRARRALGVLQRRPVARHARRAAGVRARYGADENGWLFVTGERDDVAPTDPGRLPSQRRRALAGGGRRRRRAHHPQRSLRSRRRSIAHPRLLSSAASRTPCRTLVRRRAEARRREVRRPRPGRERSADPRWRRLERRRAARRRSCVTGNCGKSRTTFSDGRKRMPASASASIVVSLYESPAATTWKLSSLSAITALRLPSRCAAR